MTEVARLAPWTSTPGSLTCSGRLRGTPAAARAREISLTRRGGYMTSADSNFEAGVVESGGQSYRQRLGARNNIRPPTNLRLSEVVNPRGEV
eukprot:2015318-Pyramimonas_sp.AAC.1